ncbi:hypothetical protein MFU01_84490 [Myxococcus fulvus]|uniref:Uncharacterized protein n=1 Tax=Myxococcus fulvus TaxID=33 RepID=A0A511TJ99_MYXFU|nr:hypothetical protein MFU01_84490 [Myxococcus fulvus]
MMALTEGRGPVDEATLSVSPPAEVPSAIVELAKVGRTKSGLAEEFHVTDT